MSERVVENLNRALHAVMADDPAVMLLGVDVLDPYGGAFKVSKGLSTRFPQRVLTTPVSEEAIVGMAAGLAMFGHKPVVEVMFGDFLALSFDQILNFVSKSVTMYGETLDLNLVIRCPVGGNRGYGPTHSQCLQKHFVGIPNLQLFEVSPFHDNGELLRRLLNLSTPCILFEDKVLYTQHMFESGTVNQIFSYEWMGGGREFAHVFADEFQTNHCTIIAPGGLVHRCLDAARRLFLTHEIETRILVPSRLYPFDVTLIESTLAGAQGVFVVEESVAGGTWGCEVAHAIHQRLWGRLKHPVTLIHSADSVIPAATHLEHRVVVQAADIFEAVARRLRPTG